MGSRDIRSRQTMPVDMQGMAQTQCTMHRTSSFRGKRLTE